MRLGTLLTFLLLGLGGFAQDPISSQIFSNPIYLNPAFAGFEGSSRIVTTYRNQWPEAGPFHRFDFSYDQSSRHLLGGFSFRYQYDYGNGGMKTHTISHAYAPTFRLFKKQLVVSPSFEVTYAYKTIDTEILSGRELAYPVYGYHYYYDYEFSAMIREGAYRHFVDFHFGTLLSFKGLVYGASFRHLTQPDHGFTAVSVLPFNIASHISYTFEVSKKVKLEPAFVYMWQSRSEFEYEQLLPSIACSIHGARIGIANRFAKGWPNAFIVMAGYERDWFRVGYSYDIGTDSKARGGSHEVNLTFKFNKKNKEDWRKGPEMISF